MSSWQPTAAARSATGRVVGVAERSGANGRLQRLGVFTSARSLRSTVVPTSRSASNSSRPRLRHRCRSSMSFDRLLPRLLSRRVGTCPSQPGGMYWTHVSQGETFYLAGCRSETIIATTSSSSSLIRRSRPCRRWSSSNTAMAASRSSPAGCRGVRSTTERRLSAAGMGSTVVRARHSGDEAVLNEPSLTAVELVGLTGGG